MKKLRFAIGFAASIGLIAGSLAVASPVGAHSNVVRAKTITVGLVTDKGGLNDKSFNHLAYVGLLNAEHNLHVKGKVLQSHSGSDYVPNLTTFANEHVSLIIAVGFLMEQALYQVGQQYPHQKFAIIDGQPADNSFTPHDLPNVADLFFKPEQSGYLAGVVAGLLEKTGKNPNGKGNNTIGSIAGANFLAVTAYNCGYQEGAKAVNSKIKVYTDFDDGTFGNTANAKGIGQNQIAHHVDIGFQVDGGAGLGYLQAFEEAHKYGIGVDADQDYISPWIITSALKRVDEAVYLTTKALTKGKFHAGPNYYSLKNNATGIVTISHGANGTHHIPSSILKVAIADEAKIKSGDRKSVV